MYFKKLAISVSLPRATSAWINLVMAHTLKDFYVKA